MFNVGDEVYYPRWGRWENIEGVVRDITTNSGMLGIEVTNFPDFVNHDLNGQIDNGKGLYIIKSKAVPINKIIQYSELQTGDTEEDI